MYDENEIRQELCRKHSTELRPDQEWLLVKILPSNMDIKDRMDTWMKVCEDWFDTDVAQEIKDNANRGLVQTIDRFEKGDLKCTDESIDVMCLWERSLL